MISKVDISRLEAAIENGNETEVHRVLAAPVYHCVIASVFCRAWNFHLVISEYRLGNQYRADFLVLSADSGCWHATFVELESPQSHLFTKKGHASSKLNEARLQLGEWSVWSSNDDEFRQDLSRRLREKDAPAYCSNVDDHRSAHTEIVDRKVQIERDFGIVIGRSSNLSTNERLRRQQYISLEGPRVRVVTYDRLLAVARKLAKPYPFDPSSSVVQEEDPT